MRLSALLFVGSFAMVSAGCSSRPFCLNCGEEDAGLGSVLDLAGADATTITPSDLSLVSDLSETNHDGGPCVPTNGGVEICDNLDNDCNGIFDDVAASHLTDPNNCGACGHICNFNGQHQFGSCVVGPGGTASCQPGNCQPGWVDADNNPATGCELACIPTNGGIEICDHTDNNCDGNLDDGFDLMNDAANCGDCGVSCARPHTPGFCNLGVCEIGTCEPGYKDLDGSLSSGCEYQCPVFPPQPEKCDNVDNDCNGAADDNPTDVGGACSDSCGAVAPCVATNSCSFPLSTCVNGCCGICMQGVIQCAGGHLFCDSATAPQLEKCNNIDDNCDGQIDEGFDKQNDPNNCGGCGTKCNVPNTFPTCTTGSCTAVLKCKPGFADANHDPTDGCEATCANPKTVETCNGIDDDCDGVVDNALVVPPNFSCVQTSICAGAQAVCCGSAGWACDYPSVNANIEISGLPLLQCKTVGGATRVAGNLLASETKCDGFDGNCNGQSDEAFLNLGKDCSIGVGECRGTGKFVCTANQLSTTCPATANPNNAKDEECNGKDDDCDGIIDEVTPAPGTMCFNGGAHACLGWHDQAVKVGSIYVYQYEASRIDASSTAPGVGTSRACSKAGVLPWTSVTEPDAAAACAAIGARLCTETEWQVACEGPSPPGTPPRDLFSYSTGRDVYTTGVCNDLNAGQPGPWSTGPHNAVGGKQCFTDWKANASDPSLPIYDLSGNVMEWTSTQIVVGQVPNTTTYYRLRGGAFNSPSDGIAPDGTSCEFDFNLLTPNVATKTVGFRCCSNNPF